ncbi:SET and WW domain protein [Talaromyces proteolyticus]|uniref:Histone-lysine N-methyltransferase, H3 lysine-36 specific n=1 Tax=Talaromyces proteolyticus TaxID=1131652 RepID=A0AAD4Q487_9EURO|nr:SET and WW domain protein [Talaromyces proteolyticus]KAH8702593.1 SET and WW domain protein [Talaromyces proteolyticus]
MPPHDDVRVNSDSEVDPGGLSNGVPAITDELKASALGSPAPGENEPNHASSPPVKHEAQARSPIKMELGDDGVTTSNIGGDITLKQEPGKPPKLSRSASQKVISRPPQLFDHLPNSANEACQSFEVIKACIYSSKYMGHTEHAMECDCAEEWDGELNHACGEDSDCINRATRIECLNDCGCGRDCQNQRFQRKEYANVAVIKTAKKGFGLRAETEIKPHQFIYEYIGEVINEANFRRRMLQYDKEGIRHFYFMSLNKGEFVDATKKGNLARFCNHSCNPNCYVDKWVVGEKLRMGIFAERHIQAGEELVFNYNVDRYGADPQPCYCGEQNCTGFIGGKTQTERATKLSNATIEALGIEDSEDWDIAVAKRPRKKKTEEPDEEYVESVQPKSLDETGVTKVMAALMQCTEKWIAVKLVGRIQRCEDERALNRVVKMHGYRILNSQLSQWKDDINVVLQILEVLSTLPALTRNKIIDSDIESTVQTLTTSDDERVAKQASSLLEVWSNLAVGYRIPRMKRDPTAITPQIVSQFERRETATGDNHNRSKSRTRSRGGFGGRNIPHNRGPRFPRPPPLPQGWSERLDDDGRTLYFTANGHSQYEKPTLPVSEMPAAGSLKRKHFKEMIDNIMDSRVETPRDKTSTPGTPQPQKADSKKESWRSYPEEKQRKIYENTIHPYVKYVVDKFKKKLPREDLKRYAKEVATKLVDSDFKHDRVEDINQVSEKQQQKIKKYCKEYFEKAVLKHRAHEKRKTDKNQQDDGKSKDTDDLDQSRLETPQLQDDPSIPADNKEFESDGDGNRNASDFHYNGKKSPTSEQEPLTKRKRDDDTGVESGNASPMKRQKSSTPLLERQSPPSEGLDEDEELPHSGLAASHQSIGVVQ